MKKIIVILVLLMNVASLAEIKFKDRVVDLRGFCKFEIGDDPAYADPKYNDDHWDKIYIPSTWEDEGYPGYDGYAWYRIHFTISSQYDEEMLYMLLGAIDDVDETYLNGELIGYSGTFPPNYITQYYAERKYLIPREYLNFNGENVIAVRVYDLSGVGGIVWGKLGIYSVEMPLRLDVEISGLWEFKTGDNMDWKEKNYDDSQWQKVPAPAPWDYYGYKDYDGFAWYRKTVKIPKKLEDENLIIFLGKIDDMDETYINGEKVGATGRMRDDASRINTNNSDYQQVRAYYIPKNLIKFGQENQIAIRVYDGKIYGGIWEGPLGIITRDTYLRYKRKNQNSFEEFIKSFFD